MLAFIAAQAVEDMSISVVTPAEIRFGFERAHTAPKRAALQTWLDRRVRPLFDGRVLPVTEDVMLRWRLMAEAGRRTGHTFAQPDLTIAATAAHHGLTVVTRNVSDCERAAVPVLDPWTGGTAAA